MSLQSRNKPTTILFFFLILVIALSACNSVNSTGTTVTSTSKVIITPIKTSTAQVTPWVGGTATPQLLGNGSNPIIMAFVSPNNNDQVVSASNQVVNYLTSKTGSSFKAIIYNSYPALLNAMEKGQVEITWLPPFTYLLAHQLDLVDEALVTNHYGIYSYGTMILANIASGFSTFFDPNSNKDTASAAVALKQFDGKRPCWVETESASGYIVPFGSFVQSGISLQPPVIAQSFETVIRALYVQQICDFGATYAISGDPRTSSSVQASMPDIMEKVIIIWRSDPVIPNLSMAFQTEFPKGLRLMVTDALVQWVNSTEGKTALTAANQYNIAGLKPIDSTYYDTLYNYLVSLALDPKTLIGR